MRATTEPPAGTRGRALLQALAEGTAGVVGDAFLRSLVRHLAEAFDAKLAFVAEAADPGGRHVRVLAGFYDGAPMPEPFEYDTDGQPCALVAEHAVVAFPEALTERFPEDRAAVEMGLQSYLALCLRGADGAHLGHLAVLDSRPMHPGEDEVAALRVFASRAAAELERRRQAAALAASRARIVEAGDAERRRLGRDLHDGAQQRLVAVSHLVTLARRRLAEGDAAASDGLLEQAAAELQGAHADLRDLARGLHPVALAERGLCGALESLAARAGVPVALDVCDDPLPDAVALAAYFVVAEALANAARYAGASSIDVRAALRDEGLVVRVGDDGCGGADPAAGTGLRGLADRVEALGGRLEVESPQGAGTHIVAVLPLAAAA
jgi:signal transduction histidine kinase